MAAQFYKINYKSDFVLTINSDAGWAVPFCIKFWTGMPSHGYFAGFDGENYVNCRVGDTPTQLLVMFDDHHMPVGPLRMQIAYHTTIEEFPDRKFDEVTNPTNVTVDIDGTEYQVMLDFTGETGAEIDFSMPSSGVMSVNGKIGYVTLNAEDVGAQPTIEDLATIRSGAAEGATAVQPAEMTAALATKQDTINDLATIRSGAAAGATAYQKPGTGIPASDLASGVQSSLQKADAAAPQSNTYTKGEVDTLIEGAISDIDVDDALSTTSENPVQNKVVTTALNGKQATISDLATIRSGAAAGATAVQSAALTPIENDIDAIEGKIPSAASASNQLADKAFVNSALADKADTSDIPTALSQLSQDSTHRVVTDAEKSTWNGKQNSIDDLATIRSGAAAGATAVQPAAMNTALAAKQDTLTFDNTPTANSSNPVKSSGIKTALDAKQSTISTVNVTVDNNTGTPSGSASVSGSTLSLSFQNLKGATGATGATGPQGPQGERGLPGESGVTGDVSGFTVIQTIDPSATYGATDIAGAATVQATNAELTELGGEQAKISVELTGSNNQDFAFVNAPAGVVTYKDVYGIDYTVGKSYTLTAKINETGGYVRIYTTTNGTSSLVANLRNNQTYTLTVASGLTAVRLGTTVDVSGTILITANDGSIQESIESIGSDVDNLKDTMTSVVSDTSSLNLEVTGSDGQSFSFSGLNGTYLVYQEVKGLDYTVGNVYKITAAISSGSYVRVYLTKNGTRSSVANLYNGQSYTFTVASGDTLLEIASTVDVSGTITVSTDNPLSEKTDYSYNAIRNDALIKYPFKVEATFRSDQTYNFLQWFNYIRLSGCKNGCFYYVKQFYNQLMSNNLYTRYLLIYEVDSDGNEREFASYSVAGTSEQYIGIEYISNYNLTAIINWTSDIPSLRNWQKTATPLLPLCCAFNDAELILPSKIRFMSGLENYIYAQMVVRNYNAMNIQGLHYDSMQRHPRHLSWTPSNTDGSYNNVPLRLMMENRNNVLIKNMDYEVVKTTSGSGKTLRCLCIGGSSTEQGYYIDHIKSLAENDSMSVTFIGTHGGNSGNAPNEGCSGWRARTFFGQYGSSDGKADRAGSIVNPFYNSNYAEFNTNAFDFSMYMANQGYSGVDCVMLAFGGNDTTATANDAAYAVDYLEAMIDSIHAYDANIKIGVWLYFAGYYQYEGTLDAIKAKQDLWEVYLNAFDGHENENIFIVPVGLGVDPLHDFPYTLSAIDSYNSNFTEIHITDWVHPAQNTGAKKVGNMCWAYLKKFGGMLS